MKSLNIKFWAIILPVALLAVAGLGATGYFYQQYQKSQQEIANIKSDPNSIKKSAQEEAKKLIEELGKLISLPDEEPTVATVADVEKLKEQSFFKNAKNGDKVVIFTNAKKAILYDPNEKKIIEVAPLNIGTPSAQIIEEEQVKILLRNGTSTVGLASKFEPKLTKVLPGAEITDKENAATKDYEKTLVVVLSEQGKKVVEKLTKELKVETSSLPAGEAEPEDVDLLIIIGKDNAK